MSSEGQGRSVLKLSEPAGVSDKGNAALGEPSIEDKIAQRIQYAETKKRLEELEKTNAELEKLLAQQEKQGKKPGKPGKSSHVANADDWIAVCTAPDLCKVGNSIVAFNSFAKLDQKKTASADVKARSKPVYRKGDVVKQVQGDAGKHVVSGTALASGHVKILEGHDTVKVNGTPVARHDSRCLVNCDDAGVGGAQGKLVTEQKTVSPSTAQAAPTQGEGPKTSARLQELGAMRDKVASGMLDLNALDEYVNFAQSHEFLDGLIGELQAPEGSPGYYGLQVGRGVLGFVKDAGLGIAELTYEGIKAIPKLARRLTPRGLFLTQLDARILAEEIRIGKISAATFGQTAVEFGKAIVEPVTNPWEKGQYVEAGTRAVTEVASIGVGWTKAARAQKGVTASTVAAAEKVADSDALGALSKGVNSSTAVNAAVHIKAASKPAFSGNWKNYKTAGIRDDPMKSAEGRRLVAEFENKGYSRKEAITEAKGLLRTGSTLPDANPIEVGDKFYKVITEGSTVGNESPFWATREELNRLHGLSYDQIADRLGMPLASQQGVRFRVVEISAIRPGTSFISVIAPTTEIGAGGVVWSQRAGGIQSLLPDRSIFTTPKPTDITFP